MRSSIIGKQSDLYKILPKGGFLDRNPNVGRQRNIHSRAGGRSVHGGNHWLRHGAHLEDHLHAGTQERLQLMCRASLVALPQCAKASPRPKSAPPSPDPPPPPILIPPHPPHPP